MKNVIFITLENPFMAADSTRALQTTNRKQVVPEYTKLKFLRQKTIFSKDKNQVDNLLGMKQTSDNCDKKSFPVLVPITSFRMFFHRGIYSY